MTNTRDSSSQKLFPDERGGEGLPGATRFVRHLEVQRPICRENRSQTPPRCEEMKRTITRTGAMLLAACLALAAAAQDAPTFADALSSGGRGPEMVVIPAGGFRMGCVSGPNCGDKEVSVTEVEIPRAFAVPKYEVTFGDSDRFSHLKRVDDQGLGRGRRPVMNVSCDDAQAYVAWLSRQTGTYYRLLTKAEWEYAARAGSATVYGWGNGLGPNPAPCTDSGSAPTCGNCWAELAPVGSFLANGFGLHDMHGNVWEWVEDCWNGSDENAPKDGRAWLTGDCDRRVVRGASWVSHLEEFRSTARFSPDRDNRALIVGFRVARMIAP